MAGKFLPLDDHDDDEEDSLLDASVRVERFERKVMGRAWAACAILSLTFAGVALYRHMSAAPAAGSDVVYPTYMPPVVRMLREWRGRGRNQRRGRGGRRGGRRGGGRRLPHRQRQHRVRRSHGGAEARRRDVIDIVEGDALVLERGVARRVPAAALPEQHAPGRRGPGPRCGARRE